jgi:exosortase
LNLANLKQNRFYEFWPLLIGLAVLYVPTLHKLFNGLWQESDQTQGPLILMVVLYLFWDKREHLLPNPESQTWPKLGSVIFGLGLLLYALGRSQEILVFEIGSQIFILAGILLITRGMSTLRALWFPLFFMFFMIPLPGAFIDAVTLPMKIVVSYVADDILPWFGFLTAPTKFTDSPWGQMPQTG